MFRCQCPRGFDGPRCQQTTRTFHGKGWAWYPPLELCEESHLSVEFLAKKPEGVILYNGPIGKMSKKSNWTRSLLADNWFWENKF